VSAGLRVRCVVFDIDDTLYLERDYVRSGFRAAGVWARDRLGIDGVGDRAWKAFLAGERDTVFDAVLSANGVPPSPEAVRDLVDVYRRHVPSISLLPDARSCLERLDGRLAIAALTDGPSASQRAKARALELARWAAPIVFTEDLGEGFAKPSPDGFRIIETQAGYAGAECLYVADNPAKDFGGPRALGWRTVRVRRPGGLHQNVASGLDVDAEIADLDHLEAAVPLGVTGVSAPEKTR
jgi:putative hydrolase of the HAD superfamily